MQRTDSFEKTLMLGKIEGGWRRGRQRLRWLDGITDRQQNEKGGSDGKVSVYNVGDLGSIPGLGRSSGEGNGNPLQYSCLENPMDKGAW